MAYDYRTCFKCHGTYAKSNLRHHVKTCASDTLGGEHKIERYDWLLIEFGKKFGPRFAGSFELDIVPRSIRFAERILQAMKLSTPELDDFASIYEPKYYESLIGAMQIFNSPSDAITLVKCIGKMLVTEYIKSGNNEGKRTAEKFLQLMRADLLQF